MLSIENGCGRGQLRPFLREVVSMNLRACGDMKIIDAPDASEFIDGVMIHPSAPDRYISIIKDICNLMKIKFGGKSQIYTQY